jgi:hypothetical protein
LELLRSLTPRLGAVANPIFQHSGSVLWSANRAVRRATTKDELTQRV